MLIALAFLAGSFLALLAVAWWLSAVFAALDEVDDAITEDVLREVQQ